MVADVIDEAISNANAGKTRLRPLPVFLHGPSLFLDINELADDGAANADSTAPMAADSASPTSPASTAEQVARMVIDAFAKKEPERKADPDDKPDTLEARARRSLEQVVLCLHRSVMEEYASSYRRYVQTMLKDGTQEPVQADDADMILLHEQADWLELAAQFEIELMENPPAVRLRQFYACIGALRSGVLRAPGQPGGDTSPPDQGARELVALNGICTAHQRVSGELSERKRESSGETSETRSQAQSGWEGSEVLKPLAAVLSGAVVGGGAAVGLRDAWTAVLLGIITSLGAAWALKYSSTTMKRHERELDLTFIPNLKSETLDRVLPTLLRRLTSAGLAPILIIDELDKLGELSWRMEAIVRYLKKLMTENVFSCFLTDRSYLEFLSMGEREQAYSKTYSYFSHSLFVFQLPSDLDVYMTRLFDTSGDISAQIDAELLKWILRHRSDMHVLELSRELAKLRTSDRAIVFHGDLRSSESYTVDLTFQVAIEYTMTRPAVVNWLALRPKMRLTLFDALYYISRRWRTGIDDLDLGDVGKYAFFADLRSRMNLKEVAKRSRDPAKIGGFVHDPLMDHDKSALLDFVRILAQDLVSPHPDFMTGWVDAAKAPPGVVVPTSEVLQSVRHGRNAVLERNSAEHTYRFRNAPPPPITDSPDRAIPGFGSGIENTTGGQAGSTQSTPDAQAKQVQQIGVSAEPFIEYLETHGRALFPYVIGSDSGSGDVYQVLSDRLGLLPSTPGWNHVQRAINHLKQTNYTGLSVEELSNDLNDLQTFKANVQEWFPLICTAQGIAAGLEECRVEDSVANVRTLDHTSETIDVHRGLLALSTGLKFRDGKSTAVALRLGTFQADLVARFGNLSVLAAPPAVSADDPLDYMKRYCRICRKLGRRRLVNNPAWPSLIQRAWQNFVIGANGEPLSDNDRPALFELVCCAAAGFGPGRYFQRNPVSVPLEDWTTFIVQAMNMNAADQMFSETSVPPHLFFFALRMLGFHLMARAQIAPALVEWSERHKLLFMDDERLRAILPARSPMDTSTKEVVVVVRTVPHSNTLEWTRPQRLETLIVVTEDSLLNTVRSMLPFVGAGLAICLRWEGVVRERYSQEIQALLAKARIDGNVRAKFVRNESL